MTRRPGQFEPIWIGRATGWARSLRRGALAFCLSVALLLVAAAGLYFVGATQSLAGCVALWCAVASGLASYLGPFWACPGEFLSGRPAASAFAFINSFGSLGSYFSLSMIGAIATKTGSLEGGFHVVATALLLASVLVLAQKLHRRPVVTAGFISGA